ncbi:hypothetical protein ACBZ90_00525 (plasmid) [Vibrio alginolyticus]
MSKPGVQTRTPEQIQLIWKHTHRDMKSNSNGKKTILYPAPYCCLRQIEELPEEAYQRRLRYAQYKECCELRDQMLRPIMQKHGVLEHFESSMQWRDSYDDIAEFVGFALKGEPLNALLEELKRASIVYPSQAGLKGI